MLSKVLEDGAHMPHVPAVASHTFWAGLVLGILASALMSNAAAQELGPFSVRPPSIDDKLPNERLADMVERLLGDLAAAVRTFDTTSLGSLVTEDRIPMDEWDSARAVGCASLGGVLALLSRSAELRTGSGLIVSFVDRRVREDGAEVSAALVHFGQKRTRYSPLAIRVAILDEQLRLQSVRGLLSGLCGLAHTGR